MICQADVMQKERLREYLRGEVYRYTAQELMQNLDQLLATAINAIEGEVESEDYPRASVILYNDHYKEIWISGAGGRFAHI